jgi:hypothetical protein
MMYFVEALAVLVGLASVALGQYPGPCPGGVCYPPQVFESRFRQAPSYYGPQAQFDFRFGQQPSPFGGGCTGGFGGPQYFSPPPYYFQQPQFAPPPSYFPGPQAFPPVPVGQLGQLYYPGM